MKVPISQIAEIIGGKIIGDGSVVVKNINGINEAEKGDLTFLVDAKYISALTKTKASAVLVKSEIKIETSIPQIKVDNPREALMSLAKAFAPPPIEYPAGIHPTASVAEDAIIGNGVSVQPYAVIEPGATIGDNTVIGAYVYIGHYSSIGANNMIYPHVTIRERVNIGKNVIIHPGCVIGTDGFGYDQVDNKNIKIPQIGTVMIGDDVEIGANSCIDRARFDKTIIGDGTKIDNLVQIGHNCEIGKNCILCGGVGISGSCKLGNNVIVAGQAGICNQVKINDNVIIGAQAGVMNNLPKPGLYLGSPALQHIPFKKREISTRQLPQFIKSLKELEVKVKSLTDLKE